MMLWSETTGFDVDPCVYFGKRFMEDLLALVLVPEEGLDFESTVMGLTFLACVFQNPAEIKRQKTRTARTRQHSTTSLWMRL